MDNSYNKLKNIKPDYIPNYDKALLTDSGRVIEFDDISSSNLINGRFAISYKNIIWHSLFCDNSKNSLLVMLNGWRKQYESPVFWRWSWYSYSDSDVLNIDDPMCCDERMIKLGWYYGTKDIDYADYVVDIVKKIVLEKNYEKVIFYASSGGGSAAIRCGSKYDDCTVIAINPQIILSNHCYSNTFEQVTSISLSDDKLDRNNSIAWLKQKNRTKYLLIENLASKDDLAEINYVIDQLPEKPIDMPWGLGLNTLSPNVNVWFYHSNYGYGSHSAQDFISLFKVIECLGNKIYDGTLNDYDISYSRMITNIWHDYYAIANDVVNQNKRINYLGSSISNAYTILDIQSLDIPMSTYIYNHIVLDVILKPNTTYSFKVNYVENTNINSVSFLIIKDIEYNNFLLKQKIIAEKNILFSTGPKTDYLEVRIYSGDPGSANDNSVHLEGIRMNEIRI